MRQRVPETDAVVCVSLFYGFDALAILVSGAVVLALVGRPR